MEKFKRLSKAQITTLALTMIAVGGGSYGIMSAASNVSAQTPILQTQTVADNPSVSEVTDTPEPGDTIDATDTPEKTDVAESVDKKETGEVGDVTDKEETSDKNDVTGAKNNQSEAGENGTETND
jgi:hypothetical protein